MEKVAEKRSENSKKSMKEERRTLFSVIEVVDGDGRHFEVEWHPALYDFLSVASPNGELTDKLINFSEEMIDDENNFSNSVA